MFRSLAALFRKLPVLFSKVAEVFRSLAAAFRKVAEVFSHSLAPRGRASKLWIWRYLDRTERNPRKIPQVADENRLFSRNHSVVKPVMGQAFMAFDAGVVQ